MSFKTLDVGCGANPIGDVNIDAYHNRKEQSLNSCNLKNINNFIFADAEKLPFRADIFDRLYASHVLEHIRNPLDALKEWKRVAKVTIILVPSAYDLDRTRTHIFTWSASTLENLLREVFNEVRVSYTPQRIRLGKIGRYLPFLYLITNRFPREIKAICS